VKSRGAWLFVTLLAAGFTMTTRAESQESVTFAQRRFQRGVDLYHAHDCNHALVELRASLAMYESPNPRLYIARCLREQTDLSAAASEFERTADEARDRARLDPRYGPTADAARVELAALTPRLGRVTLHAHEPLPAGTVVRTGGREIPIAAVGLPTYVSPGTVAIEVVAPGFARWTREVPIAAGSHGEVQITLAPVTDNARAGSTTAHREDLVPPRRSATVRVRGARDDQVPTREAANAGRIVAWTSLAVGAVGLASFGLFFALAQQQFDTLNAQCLRPCDPGATQIGRTYEWVSNVSLVVGGLGAIVSVMAFALTPSRARPLPRAAVALDVVGSPGGLGLRGTL
jgi:hypothetical protein